jgi:hypothetical protein
MLRLAGCRRYGDSHSSMRGLGHSEQRVNHGTLADVGISKHANTYTSIVPCLRMQSEFSWQSRQQQNQLLPRQNCCAASFNGFCVHTGSRHSGRARAVSGHITVSRQLTSQQADVAVCQHTRRRLRRSHVDIRHNIFLFTLLCSGTVLLVALIFFARLFL